ncbi:hypothetical protein ABIA33_007008 [Streptacidiphilus sp. MAP12-16]|uniref:DUF5134 domain-containing protein n=1 Tax=Streptacidiphilus sp. MAP12-16 TaxID=3156300 RepID=UPI0035146FDA
MTSPAWLTDMIAALMLATAAYCAGRLAVSRLWRRRTEPDVDAAHVLTGVAMAGMLVPRLDPVGAPVWTIVFAVTATSFATRAGLALRPHLPSDTGTTRGARPPGGVLHSHPIGPSLHIPHVVLSGAMLYMYLAPPSGASGPARAGGTAGMSGSGHVAADSARYPTITLVLVLVLIGYAVSVLDRTPPRPVRAAARSHAQRPVHGFLAPRAANCCDIAMSLTMVYLLVITL